MANIGQINGNCGQNNNYQPLNVSSSKANTTFVSDYRNTSSPLVFPASPYNKHTGNLFTFNTPTTMEITNNHSCLNNADVISSLNVKDKSLLDMNSNTSSTLSSSFNPQSSSTMVTTSSSLPLTPSAPSPVSTTTTFINTLNGENLNIWSGITAFNQSRDLIGRQHHFHQNTSEKSNEKHVDPFELTTPAVSSSSDLVNVEKSSINSISNLNSTPNAISVHQTTNSNNTAEMLINEIFFNHIINNNNISRDNQHKTAPPRCEATQIGAHTKILNDSSFSKQLTPSVGTLIFSTLSEHDRQQENGGSSEFASSSKTLINDETIILESPSNRTIFSKGSKNLSHQQQVNPIHSRQLICLPVNNSKGSNGLHEGSQEVCFLIIYFYCKR